MVFPRLILIAAMLAGLAACSASYSPDTYATRAVQQANPAEQGTVIGRRAVRIRADGSTGAATGGAAGAAVGGTAPGTGGLAAALGGVGGALVGGLVGSATERVAGDAEGWEYIVRKRDGSLVSVTQVDPAPLMVGARVLVIAGAQARIVPDYTEEAAPPAAPPPALPPAPAADGPAPPPGPRLPAPGTGAI